MEAKRLETKSLIYFEREKIFINLGSDASKHLFKTAYPKSAIFQNGYTIFYQSGLYQLKDGPPILILPHFLKQLNNGDISSKAFLGFFDSIKDILNLKNSFIDISNTDHSAIAFEVLIFSFLKKVDSELDNFLMRNHFVGVREVSRVVKGRWDLQKDLVSTNRPLTFTCNFGRFDLNIPFLVFLKSFLIFLKFQLRSMRALSLIEKNLNKISDVKNVKMNLKLIRDAVNDLQKRNSLKEWEFCTELAVEILTGNFDNVSSAGLSYVFRLDRFFEQLVSNLMRRSAGVLIEQKRDDILGGGKWVSNSSDSVEDIENELKAKMYSVPDIIFYNQNNYIVVECKYKPFALPFVSAPTELTTSYKRDDRNQLLSFILSIKPSPTLSNRNISFVVIYPSSEVEDVKSVSLIFDHSTVKLDSSMKTIFQKHGVYGKKESFSVKYVGINISKAIECIKTLDQSFIEKLFDEFKQNNLLQDQAISIKQRTRGSVASLIVNELKSDPNLGRTKMAKVLYLLDTHFDLKIGEDYYRAAAGPLDNDLIYGKENSVENICSKQSYFKIHEQKNNDKTERVKYVPSVNIENGLKNAKLIFVGKYDDMAGMISKISKLDTPQIEIVATLYACWNDLILDGISTPKDMEIITDFYENWHPSKKRFKEQQLINAIGWMKKNEIIPKGTGKTTRSF